jgi:hypothetical protein
MRAHNLQPRGPVSVDYRRHLYPGVRLGSHGQDHVVIGVVSIVQRVLAQFEQILCSASVAVGARGRIASRCLTRSLSSSRVRGLQGFATIDR